MKPCPEFEYPMPTPRRVAAAAILLLSLFHTRSAALPPGQDAVPTLNAPDEGKTSRLMTCRTPPDDAAASSALEQLAKGASRGSGADFLRQAAPVSRTFVEWEALTCQLLLEKRITPDHYVRLVDETLPRVSAAVALPRPELLEPKNRAVFDHYPRRTVVSWNPVNGASRYLVEVQYRPMRPERAGDGTVRFEELGWAPHNDGVHSALTLGTSAVFHFIGMQRGRVRVRPVTDEGNSGPPSEWREFRFSR